MRGRFRKSEHVETPPHRAEIGFRSVRVALSPQAGRGKPLGSTIARSVRDEGTLVHRPFRVPRVGLVGGAWKARVINGTSSLITASVLPGSQRPFENA
jgi:hypothetical protein